MAGGLITDYLEQGTAAARPAAPDAATGTLSFYFASDTEVLSFYDWNDAAWQDIPASAYSPGGADVALADGGTGASLADPNADRIMFWDDSAGQVTWLTAGTNLTITGTTIDAASGSGTAASTTEQLTGTDTTKFATADSVAALWEQGSDVASAGTISLGEGGYFNITGTTTITDIDFGTDKAGRRAWVKFAGVLTLTHNATTLILPGGTNITTAAGDTAEFISEGTDNVRCVSYQRASGKALVKSYLAELDYTIPLASSFTLENGGTASVADVTNGMALTAPSATVNARFLRYTAGLPGASWTLTMRGQVVSPHNAVVHSRAIMIRNSTSGRILTFADGSSTDIILNRWSSYTAFSATAFSYDAYFSEIPWRRATSDGTTLSFYTSCDGLEWSLVGTEAIATYLTCHGYDMEQDYGCFCLL